MALAINASMHAAYLVPDDGEPRSGEQPGREGPWRCELQTQVSEALWSAGKVSLRQIDIRTDAAHVTLRGQVRSFYLKQLAQHVAASVAGVVSVNNQLVVEGGNQ